MAFMSEHAQSECVSCQLETRSGERNSSVFQCSVWTAGFIRTPVSVSGCRENSVFNCVGHVWIKSVYACKMSGYVELRNCSVRPFASRLTNCVSACVFRQLISLEPRLSPITSQAGWLMSAGCINFFFFFFLQIQIGSQAGISLFHSVNHHWMFPTDHMFLFHSWCGQWLQWIPKLFTGPYFGFRMLRDDGRLFSFFHFFCLCVA